MAPRRVVCRDIEYGAGLGDLLEIPVCCGTGWGTGAGGDEEECAREPEVVGDEGEEWAGRDGGQEY